MKKFKPLRHSEVLPRDTFVWQLKEKMMKENKAFLKRYFKEYDLRGRVKLSIILSMIFYPGFLVLDLIYTPEFFLDFLVIRIVVVILNAVLLIFHRKAQSIRYLLWLGMALLIIDAFGIAIMIQIMGGFMSSYYQGLTLIIMCMMALLPFTIREAVIVSTIVWASYVVPSVVMIQMKALDWRIMFNNLFFLSSIIIIGGFASYVMDTIRRRGLRNLIQLEETSKKLRESNIKLKSLDELKTQFFANVNHELRTPLTLMLAPLNPIVEGKMGQVTSKQKDALITMRKNGLKLLKLINNLLDLTKLEEGQMRLKIENVDFVEYISSLLSSVKPLADQKKINLYFQHPPHRMEVTVDPDHFEKVILNLLSNAVKFTNEGGQITVYLEETESRIVLTVEDTGIGMPKDQLIHIFDRFSQIDGSLSRQHQGTGIGLSLVYEIVKLHSGKIRAQSELGKGSRFIVELNKGDSHYTKDVLDRRQVDKPVSLKKRATDAESPKVQDIVTDFRKLQLMDIEQMDVSEETQSTGGEHEYRLLIIDDNPEVLKLMKLILQDEYDLDMCSSAEEGLKVLSEKMSDLILCDVMMPGMNGHMFCKKVKETTNLKHIPVILVTARAGSEMLAEGIKSGADDYISKPFDSTELKARIRSQLRMRKAEADLALANRNLKMRTSDLAERQRSLFVAMTKSLVSALEAKDEYTRAHSARVTEISLRIAERMGLNEREQKDLEVAAILHDIGKIAIPEKILHKSNNLSEKELKIIQQHPIHGERILKPVVELNEIARVIRHHHERYDGQGYPDRLKSVEIPIGSRIMSVADTYDAITSERPYRKANSHNFAVKEIVNCSGDQFDPEVVEHFIEVAKTYAKENAIQPKGLSN
ncbi:MAG: response regulator [Candidatus Aminicenantes bacterium]|nr:response regulator [Candidatus Aminicenantes bacterium]